MPRSGEWVHAIEDTIVRMDSVSWAYAMGEIKIRLLRNLSLGIQEGECMGGIGLNSSGKTTFLNLMGALDRPTSGRVVIENVDVTEMDEKELPLE
ncbi:MAG: ATP-binding cassette domain-containing protein [Candidatus Thorarchaeota archaeon]